MLFLQPSKLFDVLKIGLIATVLSSLMHPVLAVDSFKEVPRTAHPLRPSIAVGSDNSKPAFVDLDADGDFDVAIGEADETIDKVLNYYENVGTPTEPLFEIPLHNPFSGLITEGFEIAPSFVDLDADGDFDLALGAQDKVIRFFKNVGTAQTPKFTEQVDAENPFNRIDLGCSPACTLTLAFADLDNDGDLDLFTGSDVSTGHYHKNSGTAKAPNFEKKARPNSELFTPELSDFSVDSLRLVSPNLVDIDADGDFDLIGNDLSAYIEFYENIGTATKPNFLIRALLGDANPFMNKLPDYFSAIAPTFTDIDADHDFDVFVGIANGEILFLKNNGSATQPNFEYISTQDKSHPFGWADIGSNSAPAWGDLDGDGDLDVLVGFGDQHDTLHFYENVGTVKAPLFVERTDNKLIKNTSSETYVVPTLVDIDSDGDLDVFTGERVGAIRYFENIGTRRQPTFAERFRTDNPFFSSTNTGDPKESAIAELGSFTALTFADLDNDGDLDAFIDEEERVNDGKNIVHYYENTGNASKPKFVKRKGVDNPLNENDLTPYQHYVPTLVDIDNDGDFDIFMGSSWGDVHFYENVGTAEKPQFIKQEGVTNPFFELKIHRGEESSIPSFVDIDGDNDLDAFIGVENGTLRFFENRGPANSSSFVERTGELNPLNGLTVGSEDSTPVLVDFDYDDDFDLFVLGTLHEIIYYENTGTATTPQFTERFREDTNAYEHPPTFADVDGDNDPDIFYFDFFSAQNAPLSPGYQENIGDRNTINLVMQPNEKNPLRILEEGYVRLVDIDGDGDLDAFIGTPVGNKGIIKFYENNGTATSPNFIAREESANPLNENVVEKETSSSEYAPTFADIDNDGDVDVFVGGRERVDFYENIGSVKHPQFVARPGVDNFLGTVTVMDAKPTLVDIDKDGDLDAFVGDSSGVIHFYENTGVTGALPHGGAFDRPQPVILRCADCAKIYYTLDGSEPSVASNEYTAPLDITANTTIKFITVSATGQASRVQTQNYIIDTRAPTLKILAPLTDTTLKNIPAIQGTVSEPAAGSGLERIELEVTDGTFYLTNDKDNPFSSKPTRIQVLPNEQWSYDTSNVPFSQDTQYTITVRAFDAVDNTGEDRVTVTIGDLAFTTLSLTTNSQTILQNDTLSVTGKLQRLPDIGVDLDGELLTLTVTAPDGTVATHTTTTDKLGNYVFEKVEGFIQKGSYTLQTRFSGGETLASAQSAPQSVLVGTFAGYAVLVQGKISNQEGLEAHNKTLNRVYRKLKERGFVNENIRYFNYNTQQDSDQDGRNDIFAAPSKSEIQQSLETWLRDRMNGVAAPLYLIMIDHGSPNAFLVENDEITPEELNTWLATLENNLTDVARQEPRIVILGACYSGSFIPTLSKSGRLVISSAADNEPSYKGTLEEDGIRSGEFFIEEFFQQLGRGDSFKSAFEQATRRTEIFTRQGNLSTNTANRFLDDAVQHPLLDDNGDGVGSNVLLAGDDGRWADALFLGAGADFNTNDPATPAHILAVTPTQYLSESETTTTLFLQANIARRVDPASLEIRPPSKQLTSQESTEQLNVDLEAKFLRFNQEIERFETIYDKFTEQGRYEIFYTVRDATTQELSPIKRSVIYKNRKGNQAPADFQLLSPANGAETQTVLILDWESTTDPDQDPIGYTVTVAKDIDFSEIVYQQEELSVSMTSLDNTVGLKDLTEYYWKVEAVDNFGARTTSDVFTFKASNNVNVPPNISSLNVVSALDFTALDSATVAVNDIPEQPTVYADQGRYDLLLPSGNYNATVTVPGFQPQSVTLDPQQGLSQQNIALLPINDVALLPDLRTGLAINKDNQSVAVKTTFKGGIAINGGPYRANTALHLTDSVVIKGEITVDPVHSGQLADLVVVAGYTPSSDVPEQFFMLGAGNTILPWNLDVTQLIAYQSNIHLAANQAIEIYSGRFARGGQLKVFYGYRLADGTVVFNGAQAMKLTIQ